MVDAFDTRPAQLRPSPMLGKAMLSRGRAIVSDLQFWKSSQDWTAHEAKLRAHGVLMVEGINVFNVKQGMPAEVQFDSVGLVVVGGFAPHHRASAAAQCLSHQIPCASLMFLYASRDEPPSYQDTDKVHIQAWTADASKERHPHGERAEPRDGYHRTVLDGEGVDANAHSRLQEAVHSSKIYG